MKASVILLQSIFLSFPVPGGLPRTEYSHVVCMPVVLIRVYLAASNGTTL